MHGVIDIGSNTMRLSMYRIENNHLKSLYNKKIMAGLGGHVDSKGNLSQKGIDAALDALRQFRTLLLGLGDCDVSVIATASLRNIENTEKVVGILERNTGFRINVLTGQQEAHYSVVGVRYAMASSLVVCDDQFMMADIGGGSTELVYCTKEGPQFETSLPLGSLNQFVKHVDYLVPTKANRGAIMDAIEAQLAPHRDSFPCPVPCMAGVGGSIRYTLKLYNEYFEMGSLNTQMYVKPIKKLIKSFDPIYKDSLLRLTAIAPDRVHTLIPGMIILHTVSKWCGSETISVSNYGVREGYLIEREGLGD